MSGGAGGIFGRTEESNYYAVLLFLYAFFIDV